MFKSRDVANWNPSIFINMSGMLGIGNGFLRILLFNSLKSEMNRTVMSVFGMMKVGAAHSDRLTFLRTPILTNLSTSSLKVRS